MLTQLLTVKSRLALDEFNVQFDSILTSAIKAVSARFDKETNRSLSRTTHPRFSLTSTRTRPPSSPMAFDLAPAQPPPPENRANISIAGQNNPLNNGGSH